MMFKEDPVYMELLAKARKSVSADQFSAMEYAQMTENDQFRYFSSIVYNDVFQEMIHSFILTTQRATPVLESLNAMHNEEQHIPFGRLSRAPLETQMMILTNAISIASTYKNYPEMNTPTQNIQMFHDVMNSKDQSKAVKLLTVIDSLANYIIDGVCGCPKCALEHNDTEMYAVFEKLKSIS